MHRNCSGHAQLPPRNNAIAAASWNSLPYYNSEYDREKMKGFSLYKSLRVNPAVRALSRVHGALAILEQFRARCTLNDDNSIVCSAP